jgi:bacterioferritin
MAGVGQYRQRQLATHAGVNPSVLGFLGRAMSLAFSAAQQYIAQAALAQSRAELEFAQAFVDLANEEFRHASELTERMVDLGALPAGSILTAATPAMSVLEALSVCRVNEQQLIDLYQQAYQFSRNVGSADDAALFGRLFEEERAQLVRIEQWAADYQAKWLAVPKMNRGFA